MAAEVEKHFSCTHYISFLYKKTLKGLLDYKKNFIYYFSKKYLDIEKIDWGTFLT